MVYTCQRDDIYVARGLTVSSQEFQQFDEWIRTTLARVLDEYVFGEITRVKVLPSIVCW